MPYVDPVVYAAYQARYREVNADRLRAYNRTDARLTANRIRQRTIPDKAAKYKAWYNENLDEQRALRRAYQNRDPALRNERCSRRRAAKANATPKWLTAGHEALIGLWYDIAALTGYEVDHKVPLRGKGVGGLHVPWNLQLLTPTHNRSKGNRLWP